ncbi:MAG: hypothetical protein ACKO34_05835 [Vampirovibrionales bacterium]
MIKLILLTHQQQHQLWPLASMFDPLQGIALPTLPRSGSNTQAESVATSMLGRVLSQWAPLTETAKDVWLLANKGSIAFLQRCLEQESLNDYRHQFITEPTNYGGLYSLGMAVQVLHEQLHTPERTPLVLWDTAFLPSETFMRAGTLKQRLNTALMEQRTTVLHDAHGQVVALLGSLLHCRQLLAKAYPTYYATLTQGVLAYTENYQHPPIDALSLTTLQQAGAVLHPLLETEVQRFNDFEQLKQQLQPSSDGNQVLGTTVVRFK